MEKEWLTLTDKEEAICKNKVFLEKLISITENTRKEKQEQFLHTGIKTFLDKCETAAKEGDISIYHVFNFGEEEILREIGYSVKETNETGRFKITWMPGNK